MPHQDRLQKRKHKKQSKKSASRKKTYSLHPYSSEHFRKLFLDHLRPTQSHSFLETFEGWWQLLQTQWQINASLQTSPASKNNLPPLQQDYAQWLEEWAHDKELYAHEKELLHFYAHIYVMTWLSDYVTAKEKELMERTKTIDEFFSQKPQVRHLDWEDMELSISQPKELITSCERSLQELEETYQHSQALQFIPDMCETQLKQKWLSFNEKISALETQVAQLENKPLISTELLAAKVNVCISDIKILQAKLLRMNTTLQNPDEKFIQSFNIVPTEFEAQLAPFIELHHKLKTHYEEQKNDFAVQLKDIKEHKTLIEQKCAPYPILEARTLLLITEYKPLYHWDPKIALSEAEVIESIKQVLKPHSEKLYAHVVKLYKHVIGADDFKKSIAARVCSVHEARKQLTKLLDRKKPNPRRIKLESAYLHCLKNIEPHIQSIKSFESKLDNLKVCIQTKISTETKKIIVDYYKRNASTWKSLSTQTQHLLKRAEKIKVPSLVTPENDVKPHTPKRKKPVVASIVPDTDPQSTHIPYSINVYQRERDRYLGGSLLTGAGGAASIVLTSTALIGPIGWVIGTLLLIACLFGLGAARFKQQEIYSFQQELIKQIKMRLTTIENTIDPASTTTVEVAATHTKKKSRGKNTAYIQQTIHTKQSGATQKMIVASKTKPTTVRGSTFPRQKRSAPAPQFLLLPHPTSVATPPSAPTAESSPSSTPTLGG